MSVPVIWNATAGQKAHGPLAPTDRPELERVLKEAGVDARIVPTESEKEAQQAIAREVDAGAKLIVAAGGDGTADVVAKELLDKPVALGILPLGSVMNIARMLGVPRDLAAAAKLLVEPREAVIDVAEANGEVYFEDASVGIQAAVFKHASEWEHGDLGSVVRALRDAFRYRPRAMELKLDDGKVVQPRALMVTVSNAPYAGIGMTVAPDARLDDGQFDVVVWEHFSKPQLVRQLASISFGRRHSSPHTSTYKSRAVQITADVPLPVRIDALQLGTTPLECRVRPGCLRVVVGPDFSDGRVRPPSPSKGSTKA